MIVPVVNFQQRTSPRLWWTPDMFLEVYEVDLNIYRESHHKSCAIVYADQTTSTTANFGFLPVQATEMHTIAVTREIREIEAACSCYART